MHFPSVRAPGYPYAGVIILTKTGQQHSKSTGLRLIPIYILYIKYNDSTGDQWETFFARKKIYSQINSVIMKIFSDLFEKKQDHQPDEQTVVVPDDSVHNITDGSEFLDDAIRMKEQP